MKTQIKLYNDLKRVVNFFSKHLQFDKLKNTIGRKLAITIEDALTLSLFKQTNNIATKKSVFNIFKENLNCSYKTLVESVNRWAHLAAVILLLIMKSNRKNQHVIKHIDSTDIPVCLFKNAHRHKTRQAWPNSDEVPRVRFSG